MSITQLRNVNFGKSISNFTGSTGVGYTIYDVSGNVVSARTTIGVYQLISGSGIYAANITFPDEFHGQIAWDTGSSPIISFATEQFNVEENNPAVAEIKTVVNSSAARIEQLYDIQYGRWKIVGNQMIFYKEDNSTVVATFNLFDDTGVPTMDAVFDRQRA